MRPAGVGTGARVTMPVPAPDRRRLLLTGLVGVAVLAAILVTGLAWAKWLPYADKAWLLSDSRTWSGSAIFASAGAPGSAPTLAGAWAFAVDYFIAVWKALVVALLVAAAVDALVPRDWLRRVLARRSPTGQALVGGLLSMPSMMCTCCTAPVTVGLRRRGAPLAGSIAYWIGNPLLNPAVLVFLLLVLPWQYALVRGLVGVALVVGAAALVARAVGERSTGAPSVPVDSDDAVGVAQLPLRFLRSLLRFALVLVPEYAAVVLGLGLVSGYLSDFDGVQRQLGLLAALLVAVVATLLVIPTGGEIPVIMAVTAAGAGAGLGGVLLIALPALSLPSIVMVGRSLGWRATWATAGFVACGSLVAGGLVAAFS